MLRHIRRPCPYKRKGISPFIRAEPTAQLSWSCQPRRSYPTYSTEGVLKVDDGLVTTVDPITDVIISLAQEVNDPCLRRIVTKSKYLAMEIVEVFFLST